VVGHGAAGIIFGQDGMMVFVDPNAPPGEHFRMVNRFGHKKADDDTQCINILSSGDGIHWKRTHEEVVTYRPEVKGHHLDSQNVIFWDESRKKYLAYVRRNIKDAQPQGRAIARGESDQLGKFPKCRTCSSCCDPTRRTQRTAVPRSWIITAARRCATRGRQRLLHVSAGLFSLHAFVARFLERPADQCRQPRHAIRRQPRRDYLGALRPAAFHSDRDAGEFDCYSARVIYGLVPDLSGREMYMYYRASDWLHGWDRNENNKKLLTAAGLGATQDVAVISRVVLRRDGFVSVAANYRGGEFTTPPLKFSGQRLKLNVNTTATGHVRVACLTAEGEAIPGFTLDDCDIIHTANEISHTVTWKRAPT